MEVARGTRLADVWDDLALGEKLKVTDSLVALQKKLFSVALNWFTPRSLCLVAIG